MRITDKDIARHFGALIKRLRLEKGLSQEELAQRCNLHRTYIGPVERGEKNVTIQTASKLATALDVSLSFLFQELETGQQDDVAPSTHAVTDGCKSCL
jgi:transcriptional regulator with XRE-family HTH domain